MMEILNQKFGSKIKELRVQLGMTQDDIADILNMNRTSFSKYENSAANPSLSVLRKLSKIFNVRIEYFIHDDLTLELASGEGDDNAKLSKEDAYKFTYLSNEEKLLVMRYRLMEDKERAELDEHLKKIVSIE